VLPDAVEMSQSLAAAIFGTCAAWDAAQRDVSVLLITNSLRRPRGGGVRYLQHANVRPMRDCESELFDRNHGSLIPRAEWPVLLRSLDPTP